MGRSTVSQLITRAKNMNEYDNHGVANDSIWIMHFNSALAEMAEDLKIDETAIIDYTPEQIEYDLPEDYYSMVLVKDSRNNRLTKLRNMDQENQGYWVVNRGGLFKIILKGLHSPEQITVRYTRYPAFIEDANQHPEIPNIAEDALCYKAITRALLNNNQVGKSQYFEGLYRLELGKINTANNRARG